jgi:peptidoglycan/LPS O-acetylase OafA/YrhL
MLKRFIAIFETKDRVFGLDLLRFIAIVLVVMGHARWMTEKFPTPVRALLHGSGILGVELFFVLSGFLIGGILLKQFEKNGFALDMASIKNFWVRRWFRTLPNYYLILLVYILIYYNDMPGSIWRYFFFVQSIWNTPAAFFDESWSLCIEEISYLISPIVLALSAYLFGKKGKGNLSFFLWVSVGLIVLTSFIRVIYTNYFLFIGPDESWNNAVREVALIRLDAIYYGFIAVYFSRKYPIFWDKNKIILFVIGTIGVIGLMAFQKNIVENYFGVFSNLIFFTLLSIFIGFLLPYLSVVKTTKWQSIAKPITGVSIISYSLYLVNGGLINISLRQLSNWGEGWSVTETGIIYVLYWITCLVVSAIIFVFFEKPMTDLRNRFH